MVCLKVRLINKYNLLKPRLLSKGQTNTFLFLSNIQGTLFSFHSLTIEKAKGGNQYYIQYHILTLHFNISRLSVLAFTLLQ